MKEPTSQLTLTKTQRDTLVAQLTGAIEMKRAYLASERSYVILSDKAQVTQQLATLEEILAQLV